MKRTKCAECGKSIPFGDSFSLNNVISCPECTEKSGKEGYTQNIDPTICVNCKRDNGLSSFSTISNIPLCDQCQEFFRKRPFPKWLKIAALLLAAVLVLAFNYNVRFFKARSHLASAHVFMLSGDLGSASREYTAAAELVKESGEMSAVAFFYSALNALKQDSCGKALAFLNRIQGGSIPDSIISGAREQALIGDAFDRKNYDRLLELATALHARYPSEISTHAVLASAYACKYAATGDNKYYKFSRLYLDTAITLSQAKGDTSFYEYKDRIIYRLETKDIISKAEYDKRYPHGWKKGEN
jgi:hypothetical protein